jgi:hypothetical protein
LGVVVVELVAQAEWWEEDGRLASAELNIYYHFEVKKSFIF